MVGTLLVHLADELTVEPSRTLGPICRPIVTVDINQYGPRRALTANLVLQSAECPKWLERLPDLLERPLHGQDEDRASPWFSGDEYKQLCNAIREHAKLACDDHCWEAEQLHDLVLFLGDTGRCPDEVKKPRAPRCPD
ncbi:MAG TPA: hypothetical protein VG651_08265 [Stellaceae bacterium]|nr:hypothetical protein [Stellaceae bacterium]